MDGTGAASGEAAAPRGPLWPVFGWSLVDLLLAECANERRS